MGSFRIFLALLHIATRTIQDLLGTVDTFDAEAGKLERPRPDGRTSEYSGPLPKANAAFLHFPRRYANGKDVPYPTFTFAGTSK